MVTALVATLALFVLMRDQGPNATMSSVKIPAFSMEAQLGRKSFERYCMECHGKNAGGSDLGPPLIHKIYEPNHHSDMSFYRAAKNGVQAHHWPYGDMPPVKGANRNDVTDIIRYIRELQRANGIF